MSDHPIYRPKLTRFHYGEDCTLGWLRVAGLPRIATIEPPWVPDPMHFSAPDESCVPDGVYDLVPHNGTQWPRTWALVNPDLRVHHTEFERGRFAIVIHPANWVTDLLGCVGVGHQHRIDTNPATGKAEHLVTDSRQTVQTLREVLGEGTEGHQLEIRPTMGATVFR